MEESILVIGASGRVGGHLVKLLAKRGEKVKAATRTPGVFAEGSGPGMQPVPFDLERPETFGGALEYVDRVFLMARPGDERPEDTAAPLIDAMKTAGVRYVVNLTAMGVEQRPGFGLRKVEQYLENSGMGFTHLRPNWFLQVFGSGPIHADIMATSSFHLPAADAEISYIDARDVSAVACSLLTDPTRREEAFILTGPEPLDHGRIAEAISGVAGRTISYVAIGDEVARHALGGSGLSAERIERLIDFYSLVRRGFCAPVSDAVARVTGKDATRLDDFCADHEACWLA